MSGAVVGLVEPSGKAIETSGALALDCVHAELTGEDTRELDDFPLIVRTGEEITGDVLDGPRSLAWVQAGNRLHVAKALLEYVLSSLP